MNQKLEEYILAHIDAEPALLNQIDRETHIRMVQTNMNAGHLQGRLLKMLTQMIHPQRILEIGTFVGYSALCFAEGLDEDGELHTIEIDDEIEDIARAHFALSDQGHKITLISETHWRLFLVFPMPILTWRLWMATKKRIGIIMKRCCPR